MQLEPRRRARLVGLATLLLSAASACRDGRCGADADCGSGQLCANGACVECTNDSQCLASHPDDPDHQTCVNDVCRACAADADCARNHPDDPTQARCVAGSCVACAADSDCQATQYCGNGGRCIDLIPCASVADCPLTSPICVAHTCQVCAIPSDCPPCVLANTAAECWLASDRHSTCICVALPPPKPSGCTGQADCPTDRPFCIDHVCHQCAVSSDCAAGRTCISGTCT